MYGMLLESIQHFIRTQYGEEAWLQILEQAGVKNLIFTTHRRYRDTLIVELADACSHVLKDKSKDDFMCFFGRCFVQFFTHYGYDTILRVSGRYYRDFLHGIDNLHETMRFSFPKMLSPSFYVAAEDMHGCTLHYRSRRVGYTYYVMGQLKQCAKKFYDLDVQVDIKEEEITEKGCHVVYRLNFENSSYKSYEPFKQYPVIKEFPAINASVFFKVCTIICLCDKVLSSDKNLSCTMCAFTSMLSLIFSHLHLSIHYS